MEGLTNVREVAKIRQVYAKPDEFRLNNGSVLEIDRRGRLSEHTGEPVFEVRMRNKDDMLSAKGTFGNLNDAYAWAFGNSDEARRFMEGYEFAKEMHMMHREYWDGLGTTEEAFAKNCLNLIRGIKKIVM